VYYPAGAVVVADELAPEPIVCDAGAAVVVCVAVVDVVAVDDPVGVEERQHFLVGKRAAPSASISSIDTRSRSSIRTSLGIGQVSGLSPCPTGSNEPRGAGPADPAVALVDSEIPRWA
jgi:hypothetical protein